MYNIFTVCRMYIWCVTSISYARNTSGNMLRTCSKYVPMLGICSTYVIHSFSIWTFFQHLRSDIPELMRNVKLCMSNLCRQPYVHHTYNVWQHIIDTPPYADSFEHTHNFFSDDVLGAVWEHITLYHYSIQLMPTVPVM